MARSWKPEEPYGLQQTKRKGSIIGEIVEEKERLKNRGSNRRHTARKPT